MDLIPSVKEGKVQTHCDVSAPLLTIYVAEKYVGTSDLKVLAESLSSYRYTRYGSIPIEP